MTVQLKQSSFGVTAAGDAIDLFTFTSTAGVSVSVINYGGTITSLLVPDRMGELADIVLGYDTLAEYESCEKFVGCIVGRYANRIKHGKFTIEDSHYQLELAATGHHIHGGPAGFHKQVWRASVSEQNGVPELVLKHHSPHGQGGYPGNLDCVVTYSLSEGNEISIDYQASSDRSTVINLTNHSYFNLGGHQHAHKNGILDHVVVLNSDEFIPTDSEGIPISGPVSVSGTPMDFRMPTAIGERIDAADEQLQNGSGYDHNWVVNNARGKLAFAARVFDPTSGRTLEVDTTQPGLQFYTSNHVDALHGKAAAIYRYRGAMCLETQHFPDSPNHHTFPATVVTPEKSFHQVTRFRVGSIQ